MTKQMQAAVMRKPGVIEVTSVPCPEPKAGEVLLKVEACALCGTDQRVLSGEKAVDVSIVGHEITGRVEAVGAGVTGWRAGQRCVVQTVIGCGRCPMCRVHRENLCENTFKAIGYQFDGGFAEYMIMPKVGVDQGCLIPIPDTLPADQGTLIEPLSCCVNGMASLPMEQLDSALIFGGGIIGVLNGLVAHARGCKRVAIADVSEERLGLLKRLGLPFAAYVNSRTTRIEDWVRDWTGGRGVDAVVVAASVKALVTQGIRLLARAGHLSIFAGLPKSDPVEPTDLNVIHYRELNLHGANSSAIDAYRTALDFVVSKRIDAGRLVTHRFPLSAFHEAVKTQADPSTGALKVVIVP